MKKTNATAVLALLLISALDLCASDCVGTTGGISVAIPAQQSPSPKWEARNEVF